MNMKLIICLIRDKTKEYSLHTQDEPGASISGRMEIFILSISTITLSRPSPMVGRPCFGVDNSFVWFQRLRIHSEAKLH